MVEPTPLENITVISQLGWVFPRYGKIKHVPTHQPIKGFGQYVFPVNWQVECGGPKSIKLTHVFPSTVKCYWFLVKMKQAHTVCWQFVLAIPGKNMQNWKYDHKNISLLVAIVT